MDKQSHQIEKEDWGKLDSPEITSEVSLKKQSDQISKLKYPYATDELGRLVSAQGLSKEDKLNHEYYIEGITDTGTYSKEKVILAVCKDKRNYFRRYPTDSAKYTGDRVHTSIKQYNESVLHKLVKQTFAQGKITAIMLPPVIIELAFGSIKIAMNQWFPITKVDLEYTDKSDNGNLRYDILVQNAKGKKLAIEVLVSHAVDKAKQSTIKRLGVEAIEIDFSDLAYTSNLISNDMEHKILERLTNSVEYTHWINNSVGAKVQEWFDGLHIAELKRNQYKQSEDGQWGLFAFDAASSTDRHKILSKCPYITENQRTEYPIPSIYIVERQCEQCQNHLYANWDEQSGSGISICSHSAIPSGYIIALLAKLNDNRTFWNIS